MNILITGGLGHIGSHLLENIGKIRNVKKIFVIDNLSTQRYVSLFNIPKSKKNIFFYEKDLSIDKSLLHFRKVDVVINLASITDAEGSLKIKNKIYKNNLGVFKNIINYCLKNSSKLIHISSTSVYGDQKGLVDEECENLNPKSPYASIKIKEENILKKNKISYVTYRFGTISGVSKGMRFHTAINKFCLSASLGKPLPIWKSMMNKPKPYLSLNDAFKVFKFTLENSFFKNQTYNIISEHLTLKTIIDFFKKYKKSTKIKFVSSKLINQYSYKVSKQKFNNEGFVLKSKIKNDINSTLKLFKGIQDEM